MLNINDLRLLCVDTGIAITQHAKNRLIERGISVDDVKYAVQTGEIITQYEDDKPFPSCLILGSTTKGNSVHVVASIDGEHLYIITAYCPNEEEWNPDFKTRKERK